MKLQMPKFIDYMLKYYLLQCVDDMVNNKNMQIGAENAYGILKAIAVARLSRNWS